MNTKHTVVIRKDLNMTPGLMAAQVAHISDAFMRERIRDGKEFNIEEKEWMLHPYITVLTVDNIEELNIIVKEAEVAGLMTYRWLDIIPSKNLNRPIPDVLIGCSIGPCDSDRVKAITGTLPLA